MAQDWRRELYEDAMAAVCRFVKEHEDFSFEEEEPDVFEARVQLGTNFVLWGYHSDEPVVYKWYAPNWGAPRFRSEQAALLHFSPTGYVPKIHAAISDQLIVMDRLLGRFLGQEASAGELDAAALDHLGREFGHVVGLMVDTPLPNVGEDDSLLLGSGHIPWSRDLVKAVRFFIDLCRRDHGLFEASSDPFYGETLALVESQLDRIPGQRQVFLHEDLHCYVHRGCISGIFDMECCRLGTDLMQLERAFRECAPDGVPWSSVLAGYEATTGRVLSDGDYIFMLAMEMSYYHIRITRWGNPDKKQDWVEYYLPDMRRDAQKYEGYVDLAVILPSL